MQPARQQNWSSAGDDQVHGLRAFALLVGLDFELNPLSFVERFQAGLLDRADVHAPIAPAVVRLDETVAAFAIEELDRTTVCHRQTPSPANAPPPTPTARRLGQTFTSGEGASPRGLSHSPDP